MPEEKKPVVVIEQALIPETHLDMFEGSLIPHLTTLFEDGSPRCAPLWCDFDGEYLRFTNTTNHIVYQTITKRPQVVVTIADPSISMRYLEVRGVLEKVEEDPQALHLAYLAAKRGAGPFPTPAAPTNRVILYIRPTWTTSFAGVI
ncbi:pyridoxamine 5'-phosphate oxidase family protein [Granulicella sibirica]|uniref:Pyridoxamine 5'-phosphate oxidase-related, FMN-binding n=1 Tax=Granulicella sibirica TaxID=2479048 RepID=A0A4V1L568_9BACT|nr:pyridoxamine 5'-phosphate oxidase family protein [Granulicella sibirica]RXH54714.1 pyridoxamine 5'-phosphate oxidase-related, FMN-binding [Granulicella sibirica]